MSVKKYVLIFIIGLVSSRVEAACTSPAGDTGHLTYSGVMKFCNGTTWTSTVSTAGASCAGTTAGTINYLGGDLRVCNGTTWYNMKGASLGSCAGTTAGTYNWSGTTYRFCDGTNWYNMASSVTWYSGITYVGDGGANYGTCVQPSEANLNDEDVAIDNSWGSASTTNAVLVADLGSSKTVSRIRVGGRGASCWGAPSSYWNTGGASVLIQTSPDNSAWTTYATGNQITYDDYALQDITFASHSARYVRIFLASGWLATGQFRIGN